MESEKPSLTALTPVTCSIGKSVHSCSVPLNKKINFHTIVGGCCRLQWCVVTSEGSDQPS